jgi:hypothetical protein
MNINHAAYALRFRDSHRGIVRRTPPTSGYSLRDRIFSGNQKTESFWRLRRQTALGSNLLSTIEDEDQDLRQNASQASIDRQFYPLIEDENLSELPEPPLISA